MSSSISVRSGFLPMSKLWKLGSMYVFKVWKLVGLKQFSVLSLDFDSIWYFLASSGATTVLAQACGVLYWPLWACLLPLAFCQGSPSCPTSIAFEPGVQLGPTFPALFIISPHTIFLLSISFPVVQLHLEDSFLSDLFFNCFFLLVSPIFGETEKHFESEW